MAALIERSGRYYAQFYNDHRSPRRKRFSLKTSRKRIAQRLLLKLEDDYAKGAFDPWQDDPWSYDKDDYEAVTIHEAMERFLTRKKQEGRAESTIRTYREIIRLLVNRVNKHALIDEVSASAIRAFIRRSDLAKATQHKRYGHLRTFFRWCQTENMLRRDPIKEIEKPSKPHKIPKAVTKADLEVICKALREDYEEKKAAGYVRDGEMIWRIPLFWFALYTGMRASELARLRWKDIDVEKGLIYIRKQKNQKEQTIPLNRKAREVLETVSERAPDDYVFASPDDTAKKRGIRNFRERASKAFREARRDAELREGLSFHSLRHGFCTMLAEAGKSAFVIKKAARHADISTSLRYVHLANEHLRKEVEDAFST